MPRGSRSSDRRTTLADRAEVRAIAALLQKRPLSLSDYYAVGEQLRRLAEEATVASHGSRWRSQVAEAVGVSESTLNKALQFRQTFAEADVAEVEKLGVGWSRLAIVLAVKNPKKRMALLRRASREGLGDRELQKEIQRRKGSRRGGGRPRKEARSQGLLADLGELARLAGLLNDFDQKVWAVQQETYGEQLSKMSEDGRQAIREELNAAEDRLRDVKMRIQTALQAVRAIAARIAAEGPG